MSEIEEPQQQSIQARIAALNLGQVGRSPVSVPSKTSPRPPPPKPPLDRSTSAISPNASSISNGIGNEPNGPSKGILPPPNIVRTGQKDESKPAPPPRLPPRRESTLQQVPALPPRRPSELSRKGSQESVSSVVSSVSALSNGTSRSMSSRTASMDNSRVRAPVYDPATLPPLPPSRREQQEKAASTTTAVRAPLKATRSTSYIANKEIQQPPRTPTLPQRPSLRGSSPNPPSLPSRPPLPQRTPSSEAPPPPTYTRRLPPTTIPPVKSRTEDGPTALTRSDSSSDASKANGFNKAPPPVPVSTRPDLSKIMTTKPKICVPQPSMSGGISEVSCLKCRDFSGPDQHAAQFPRQNVPSLDWLAIQLTDPFPSTTDKARSIFTWLHHNIDYNVEAFFNHTVKPSTPAGTLDSGLAVCEGYAGLFTALATKAGLESIVVGGHGKGYGIDALKPGEPVPPKSSNHAWNAVKIDNGEWKLLDSCWGAGHINGPGQPYSRKFNATQFTQTNEEFGLKHFPNDPGHFFRADGRILTWEEYIVGEFLGQPANIFADPTEGFSNESFTPKQLKISTSPSAHTGPTVRFQFQRTCEHWDPIRNGKGKPYQYVLSVGTPTSGPAKDFLPFDTNGTFWWVDVPVEKLGAPGERVMCAAVETLSGKNARGLTKAEYLKAKGRTAVTFKGFAFWELV